MRTLYHFATSPFARRTRLALAHKQLEVALKDPRVEPAYYDEAFRLWPLRLFPVMVDGPHVLGDSTAIAWYLDGAYATAPRLWPSEPGALRAALEIATLVDGALNALIDVGTRYYALHADPAWAGVQAERLSRAQGALETLAERAAQRGDEPMTDAGWCAADMWLFTASRWMAGLPARAATSTNIAQIVSLPWSLPAALSRWADAFADRPDVKALDASPIQNEMERSRIGM